MKNSYPLWRKHGQAFADQIRGIPSELILCVSLEINNHFHVVMIHNALGDIVTPVFEIDTRSVETGFDRLCHAVYEAVLRTGTQLVLLGMEPTSHYFENLARHLLQRPPLLPRGRLGAGWRASFGLARQRGTLTGEKRPREHI